MRRGHGLHGTFAAALALGVAACDSSGAGATPSFEAAAAAARAGRVIRVPEDQPTIAAAMAAARPGDTVKLATGTYREALALKAGVKVVGGPSTIDATGLDHGITGEATVKDASVSDISVQGSTAAGIFLDGSEAKFRQVASRGSGLSGLALVNGAKVSISQCELSGNAARGLNADQAEVSVELSQILDNGAAGIGATSSRVKVSACLLRSNGGAGNVRISYGSSASLDQNQILDAGNGVVLDAGDDPADPRPPSAWLSANVIGGNQGAGVAARAGTGQLESNRVDGNGYGMRARGASTRIESEGDTFDGNAANGVLATDGASVSASDGSVSGNGTDAVYASDVDFECANDDCSLLRLLQAPTRVALQRMRIEGNAWTAVAAVGGGDVSVQGSSLRGGAFEGLFGNSRVDYDLGDGVPRSVDVPVRIAVHGSAIESNGGWCAQVLGSSRLEMGAAGAGNSCTGNGAGVRVADGGMALLQENRIAVNAGHGVLSESSAIALEGNVISGNAGQGVWLSRGTTGLMTGNEISDSGDMGIRVDAGFDLADQRRSFARLGGNLAIRNSAGLGVQNSDVRSDGDRFEGNVIGAMPSFGARLAATGGSLSANRSHGLWSLDTVILFFCADPACTSYLAPQATVHVSLDHMKVDGNGELGLAAIPGGEVTIASTSISGNGTDGILVDSAFDADLGNGARQHLDVPGAVRVRSSRIDGNTGWCALVTGRSRLDMGGATGGGNSCTGSRFAEAIANLTAAVVPAKGNWWGTADAAAIAARMLGPVDYVPFLTAAP